MSSLQHSNRIITRQDQNRRSASWQESLILDHYRRPRAVLANALHAFRTSPEFDGVLLFNRFSCRIVIRNSPPWRSAANSTQWADNDDVLAADWLQHHGIHVSPAVAAQAAAAAASDNPFHPVRDYLDSLNWDGVDALGDLLPDYFGAERNAYTAAVSVRWLISLVARIYQPGCKADRNSSRTPVDLAGHLRVDRLLYGG